ncbi:hypothetical protein B0T10DRAFT_568299 [Thelonectria olida]|uniref:Peptidase S9 prolyl oligopeptidase catalytic domain-containing protein n=1 Tax=Thelonectria olida TaxID=1576542 RepID=A0A9P8VR85_9HYPO|nr:hypothetical protein B0T10DRAFT_568299 [Thelonectria olida]
MDFSISKFPGAQFAITAYGPISTNVAGRSIVANKPPLPPVEKQALHDTVQPDIQLNSPVSPVFTVYSNNDPVVPVINAYRLAGGIKKAGGSVEFHIFADAPYGFALDTPSLPVSNWPLPCEIWLKQNKWME